MQRAVMSSSGVAMMASRLGARFSALASTRHSRTVQRITTRRNGGGGLPSLIKPNSLGLQFVQRPMGRTPNMVCYYYNTISQSKRECHEHKDWT
jgi:hypothetical protein